MSIACDSLIYASVLVRVEITTKRREENPKITKRSFSFADWLVLVYLCVAHFVNIIRKRMQNLIVFTETRFIFI